jgi:hypothetical protein
MTDVRQKKLRLKDLHLEKELGDASDMSGGSLKDLKPSLWTLGKVVLTAPAAILVHAIKSRNAQVNPSIVTHLNSLADLSEIQKAIERLVTCAIGSLAPRAGQVAQSAAQKAMELILVSLGMRWRDSEMPLAN